MRWQQHHLQLRCRSRLLALVNFSLRGLRPTAVESRGSRSRWGLKIFVFARFVTSTNHSSRYIRYYRNLVASIAATGRTTTTGTVAKTVAAAGMVAKTVATAGMVARTVATAGTAAVSSLVIDLATVVAEDITTATGFIHHIFPKIRVLSLGQQVMKLFL